MAERVSKWRRIYDRIPDCIWPHLEGNEVPEPELQRVFGDNDAGIVAENFSILSSHLKQADERSKSVDSKLIALLTLTSILAAAISASFAAAVTLGSIQIGKSQCDTVAGALTAGIGLVVFYVACQLIRSVQCTVDGLKRRSYRNLGPDQIRPQRDEDADLYRLRLVKEQLVCVQWNEWIVDQKVGDMAVAHISLSNALFGSYLLIVSALAVLVVRSVCG